MKPIIIGSGALNRHLEQPIRTTDLDLICLNRFSAEQYIQKHLSSAEFVSIKKSDKFNTETIVYYNYGKHVEITYPLTSICTTAQMFTKLKHELKEDSDFFVPSLNLLYTLKLSHRFVKDSPHFFKTRNHCRYFEKLGAQLVCQSWYDDRIVETYNYESYSLKMKASDFFNSNFDYIYDHDSIHEAVKLLDAPAYTKYMSDGEEVMCSVEKFYAQPFAIRIAGVLEESYVLALERSQIPFNFEPDPKKSFLIALEKVCTSITSGWFRDFAWTNYFVIAEMYNPDYVEKFKTALESGKIKPYKKVM